MKTLIAMSGGVDSSAAAGILIRHGDECEGVTFRLCPKYAPEFEKNEADAAQVCRKLGIKHRVLDLTEQFDSSVIAHFISEYEEGRTPNPCIYCNRYIKFGYLSAYAENNGFDRIATGHYARIEYNAENGAYELKKALDAKKDQSYVLYNLNSKQLSKTVFPLGAYTKDEVRKVAEEFGFKTAHKSDSQDICFVPDGDYAAFIEKYTGKKYPYGDFIGPDGRILGRHQGQIRYTVGQRKGLGLSLPEPLYVGEKRVSDNTVRLCKNEDLFRDSLTATDINVISREKLSKNENLSAKIRYSHVPTDARVEMCGNRLNVVFAVPQRAVTPGQSVVIYEGDTVVAGGTIE